MRVSRKNSVQGQKVLGISKSIETTKRKPQPHRKRRPANPPARLAFRQRKQRSKQQKKNNTTQKRGQSPNKNTHRIDLHLDAVAKPLHRCQKHAKNELYIAATQADMKNPSSEVNPKISQAVHESRAKLKSLSESSQVTSSWAFMDIIVILLTVSCDHKSKVK